VILSTPTCADILSGTEETWSLFSAEMWQDRKSLAAETSAAFLLSQASDAFLQHKLDLRVQCLMVT
jgi:hypothetical protein